MLARGAAKAAPYSLIIMSTTQSKIPGRGGIGLKSEHYRDLLARKPNIGFLEIHAENYMGDGGAPHRYLAALRDIYPISLHGVGLSIGGPRALDREHLRRLKSLDDIYQPALFSEHLAWSTHEAGYLADLLPLPYTEETLERVCNHIDETQRVMKRQMLLENPSSYLTFDESCYSETDFIREIVKRTGCGLLFDINNVFVSAHNLKTDARSYIADYPLQFVHEIHLAGHDVSIDDSGETVLIDAHGSPVVEDVWALYADVIARTGSLPTLIERDNNVPELSLLVAEAHKADKIMLQRHGIAA
jgi:uncharacterized protein